LSLVLIVSLSSVHGLVGVQLVNEAGQHIYKEGPLCSVTQDTPFSVIAPNFHNLTGVAFWCADNLNGFRVYFSDNSTAVVGDISSGSPTFLFKWNWWQDSVAQVDTGCFSSSVNQFQLTLASGLPSQVCGTTGSGTPHTVQIPAHYQLVGFFGEASSTGSVTSIGVYLRTIYFNDPLQQQQQRNKIVAVDESATLQLLSKAERDAGLKYVYQDAHMRAAGWQRVMERDEQQSDSDSEGVTGAVPTVYKFGPMCPVLQNAGTMFSVVAPVHNNITYVRLWCLSHTDGIEFTYSNGQTAVIGDTSGSPVVSIDTIDDPIAEIDYTCEGSEIGQFVIVQLSGNQSPGCGSLSNAKGTANDENIAQLHTIQIPGGYHLVGMFGQTQTGYPVTIGTYIRGNYS